MREGGHIVVLVRRRDSKNTRTVIAPGVGRQKIVVALLANGQLVSGCEYVKYARTAGRVDRVFYCPVVGPGFRRSAVTVERRAYVDAAILHHRDVRESLDKCHRC